MCFCLLMLVMASITVVMGASFRTLNSMMPRCTDVGYERRFCGLFCVFKDVGGNGYNLWFCLVLEFYCKVSKEGLQCAIQGDQVLLVYFRV